MTLPTNPFGFKSQLSMGQIADEFGETRPNGEIRLGDYKKVTRTSNYPQVVGELSFPSIDGGGQVPVDTTPDNKSVQISIDDFKGTRLQQVVNFWSSGAGGTRLVAKSRYSENGTIGSNNEVTVIGGYRSRPPNPSGTRVHIHVNKNIGSNQSGNSNSIQRCALRTGNWESGTILSVDVAGEGRIQGAGGKGGNGGNGSANGSNGEAGTSGLGIQYSGTTVTISNGGVISGGFGGGGGGGGGFDYDHKSWRTASGGGGGGGAGLPQGEGGSGGTSGANGGGNRNGTDASSGDEPGEPGNGGNNGGESIGGEGGEGGKPGEVANDGENGFGSENPNQRPGGEGGATGAAIRFSNSTVRNNFGGVTDPSNSLNGRGSINATGVV